MNFVHHQRGPSSTTNLATSNLVSFTCRHDYDPICAPDVTAVRLSATPSPHPRSPSAAPLILIALSTLESNTPLCNLACMAVDQLYARHQPPRRHMHASAPSGHKDFDAIILLISGRPALLSLLLIFHHLATRATDFLLHSQSVLLRKLPFEIPDILKNRDTTYYYLSSPACVELETLMHVSIAGHQRLRFPDL
ncbi:unnamed protein product [Pleuronectes platessa]|uniref:Uncharacterized protein n=1 Tax=Pleuronectes platessa TaxID=8262 RepID=A0A9N7UKC5_PLEPL|nr:unnamed protein product [Pleuronectes platessa]